MTLYFQRSTDLALQYKMATEFQGRGLKLPTELASAEQSWNRDNDHQASTSTPGTSYQDISDDEGEQEFSSIVPNQVGVASEGDERYDGSLAPVFVLPEAGNPSVSGVPAVNDPGAISRALQTGSDLRTIRLDDGTRLRLLTYHIGNGNVLQVGRLLIDQDRLLSQYLTGLMLLGSAASLVLALASWGLAGRSIKPTQRAWDQQQQFISNASHELRTPMTILRANADYALHSTSDEERESSLRDILDECDYMNCMVQDLLLLSRIDAHHLVLANDLIPLIDLLTETIRQVEKVAAAKKVKLKLEAAQGIVRGDRVKLRQLLLILLDNALRFTPAGGSVRLGALVRGHEAIIRVTDNGSGIPDEHLAHIFERFYQVPGQSGEGRGNGLGLAIAQGIAQAHKGRIEVSSTIGKGTTFSVLLDSTTSTKKTE
jgi:signal transduction histidine kinase